MRGIARWCRASRLPHVHTTQANSTRPQADDRLRDDPNLNHEYLPIAGLAEFTTASQKLVLGGDSPAIKEKRVRTPLHHVMT